MPASRYGHRQAGQLPGPLQQHGGGVAAVQRPNTDHPLEIAEVDNGNLVYRGKVGSGFDEKKLKELYELLSKEEIVPKPVPNKVEMEKNTIWIEAKHFCEVEYASITKDGQYREAVFKRMRPDLDLK